MNHLSQCWSEAIFYLLKSLLLSLVFAYIYLHLRLLAGEE